MINGLRLQQQKIYMMDKNKEVIDYSINQAVNTLGKAIPDPNQGLPDPIFYFISRTTPLINVDLLVKDANQRVLLSWRDDDHSGKGWHVPGGIIRYKERIKDRIDEVAINEIGSIVDSNPSPITVCEFIADQKKNRAHFISLLYACTVGREYQINNHDRKINQPGYLMWHENCPDDLLPWHEVYRKHIEPN